MRYDDIFRSRLVEAYLIRNGYDLSYLDNEVERECQFVLCGSDYYACFERYCEEIYGKLRELYEIQKEKEQKDVPICLYTILVNMFKMIFYHSHISKKLNEGVNYTTLFIQNLYRYYKTLNQDDYYTKKFFDEYLSYVYGYYDYNLSIPNGTGTLKFRKLAKTTCRKTVNSAPDYVKLVINAKLLEALVLTGNETFMHEGLDDTYNIFEYISKNDIKMTKKAITNEYYLISDKDE